MLRLRAFTSGRTFTMPGYGAQALVLAAALSGLAAFAHLACIALGPRAYRFMGAGERMARAVEAGKTRPALVTLAISGVLGIWTLYALSGAGIIVRLPFTDVALAVISIVLLVRAVGFPLLRPVFPGNSNTFWLVSSGVCLVLGVLYALGALAAWGFVSH